VAVTDKETGDVHEKDMFVQYVHCTYSVFVHVRERAYTCMYIFI